MRIAARLATNPILSIESIGGGRNSQVYRVVDSNSRSYALKVYFQHTADHRDRLWTEFSGLRFLWQNGVRDIPAPLAADRDQGVALYEYVDGEKLAPDDITATEIRAAVSFLAHLKAVAHQASLELPAASEACFSGRALLINLQERLEKLLALTEDETGAQDLRSFLTDEFIPVFESTNRRISSVFSSDKELPWSERTLSPSDFGFHNALRCHNGRLVFLDFEYFGWDDPAKMLSDFLLHPAMQLSEALKKQFAIELLEHFKNYSGFAERVKSVYPAYGLKWCLILLNEFLPVHSLRRQFAESRSDEFFSVRMQQLSKARLMLQKIKSNYEHFPYFAKASSPN